MSRYSFTSATVQYAIKSPFGGMGGRRDNPHPADPKGERENVYFVTRYQ
jgi:hypothetical protein